MLRVLYARWFAALIVPSLAAAQMPPARFSPNVDLTNAAYVRAVARLPSGQIVIGGNDLQRVGGAARNFLARLNGDGSLDASWNPAPNGGIGALWVDAAGMLYVGGAFTTIAGQPRSGIARFDAGGNLDPNWLPSLDGGVNAIAPGLPGSVCFGGTFLHVGGAVHHRLACVSDVDGAPIAAFAPDVDNTVSTLLGSGSNLYVGGYFATVSGTPRAYAARLALAGSGAPDSWNPAPGGTVLSFLPGNAGEVYLAGFFSAIGATLRPGIAKVNDTTGALIGTFDAQIPVGDYVLDLCPNGSGGLVAVGTFASAGGQARRNAARLDGTTGNALSGFDPGVDYGYPLHVLAEPGGSYLIAGPFSALGGGEHLALGRVLGNGSVDATFDPALETQGFGYVIARVPTDGTYIVGGRFARADGLIRRNVFKLAWPGRVDPNWIAHTDEEVRGLTVDDIGRVYVSGYFTHVDGVPRASLARLQNTADGALDAAWNPQPNGMVYYQLMRPEGLYVSGSFGTIGGGTQNSLARLSLATGSLDSGWKPVISQAGNMALTADAQLLVVGAFTTVNGTARAGAAKLGAGAAATLDPSWAPTITGGGVAAIAADGDDVYLGGTFTAVNGTPRAGFARVSGSGTGVLDTAWQPSANNQATKIVARPEGVYVAGLFSSIDAGGHGYLARLDKNTGAIDPSWQSAADNWVFDVLPFRESVFVVGWFSTIGGSVRQAVGRLPIVGDTIFVDDFSG